MHFFETAAEVYHHKKDFLKVLDTVKTPNLKLKSVMADLKSQIVSAFFWLILFETYRAILEPHHVWQGVVLRTLSACCRQRVFWGNVSKNLLLCFIKNCHWSAL